MIWRWRTKTGSPFHYTTWGILTNEEKIGKLLLGALLGVKKLDERINF